MFSVQVKKNNTLWSDKSPIWQDSNKSNNIS